MLFTCELSPRMFLLLFGTPATNSDVDQLQLRRATAPQPGHPDPIPSNRGPSSKRLSARPRQLFAPEASKLSTVSPSVTAKKQRLRAFNARARVTRPSRCRPNSICASLVTQSRAAQHSPRSGSAHLHLSQARPPAAYGTFLNQQCRCRVPMPTVEQRARAAPPATRGPVHAPCGWGREPSS